LGAIALAVIAVVVLGSGKFFKQTLEVVCYFEGDIKGLNIGSPVVFRGVKIGSVTNIIIRFDPQKLDFKIPVFIEIEPDRLETIGPRPTRKGERMKPLIDKGLRAQLEMQSFVTGQLQVGLDFFPDKPAKFVGADPKYIEIPTVPTPLEELAKKIEKLPIEKIFEKLLAAVDGIEKVVNSPELKGSVRSLQLALEDVRKLVHNLDNQVGPLASNLNETVKETRGVVHNLGDRIGPLSDNIEKTIKSAEATLNAAQKAIEGIDGTVGEGSTVAYELTKTLEEVSSLARSIRHLTDYLERHPEALLRGK
jgi:paraquat-inducible protein B